MMNELGERFSAAEHQRHKEANDCAKKLADLGITEPTAAEPDADERVCKPKTRKQEAAGAPIPSAGETTLKVEMYMEKLQVFELWTERIFSALERLLQDIECIEEAVREENLENTSRMYSGLLLAKMYSTVALLLEQVMGMAKPPHNSSSSTQIQQSPFCSVFKQDTNGRLLVTLHEAFLHAALAYLQACDRENAGNRDEYLAVLHFITMYEPPAAAATMTSSSSSSGGSGSQAGSDTVHGALPFLSKHSSFFKMVRGGGGSGGETGVAFLQRFRVSRHYRLVVEAEYHLSPRHMLHELSARMRDAIQDALAMERYTCRDHKRLVMVLEKRQWEGAHAGSGPGAAAAGSGGMRALFDRYRNTDDTYLVFVYNLLQTMDATAARTWHALMHGCACGHRFHVRCEPQLYD